MKYELSHDTIARLVFDKASSEARTRRKVEKYIRERREAYLQRGVQLTEDDLDYIDPYLDQIRISTEEEDFLEAGRKALLQARRKKRVWAVTLFLVLLGFSLVSFSLWRISEANALKSKAMRIALAAKYGLYEGKPSLAFRLAQETLLIGTDTHANRIANEVLRDLKHSPLVMDFEHEDTLTHVQFSPNQQHLLTASLDGKAKLWDYEGNLVQEFVHPTGITRALIDSNLVITATQDHQLFVWEYRGRTNSRFPTSRSHPFPRPFRIR